MSHSAPIGKPPLPPPIPSGLCGTVLPAPERTRQPGDDLESVVTEIKRPTLADVYRSMVDIPLAFWGAAKAACVLVRVELGCWLLRGTA